MTKSFCAAGADYGLLLVVLLSGAIFFWAHWPAWVNPYVINDDVRQQIYWMQQWQDPGLFAGDLFTAYARHYVTWGVVALYWLASLLVGPLAFSKLLPGILFVFLAGCVYKIGENLVDGRLGGLMAAILWLNPFFLDNMAGGLARAFAPPLLAWFWLCWQTERPWGMAAGLLLQALFIPYIFLVSAGAVALAWLQGRLGRSSLPPFPAQPVHFLVLAAGAALVLGLDWHFAAAGFGPLVSLKDMMHHPEFGAHGRYALLPMPSIAWEVISPWEFLAPFRDGGTLPGLFTCALVIPAAAVGVWRVDWQGLRTRLRPVVYLGLASLLLYGAARVMLLKLFVPDRYLMTTLNLFYCLGLGLGLREVLRLARWPRYLAVGALILVAVLSGWRLYGVGLKDYSAYRPLYAALAATPKDAVIAGHPYLADTIPTFARRPTFVTFELAHVWSKGFWNKVGPRYRDFFTAYYAADPKEVVAFCRKYGVSFLVVDDRHFTPAFLQGSYFLYPYDRQQVPGTPHPLAERNYCPFFAPFDEQIRHLTQGRSQFALLSTALFPGQVMDQHLRLIDMRPWLTENP